MSVRQESNQLLHGPARTRLGRTLILDLTAPQLQMVVERGSTLARGSVVVTTCARRLIELSRGGEKVNTVAVVGSEGDPTDHPDLREVTENLRTLRDKWFPRAKLVLMTDSRDLEGWDLRATFGMYDKVFLRYEWGTAKVFSAATGDKGTQLGVLTRQLQGLDHLVVQANFFRGDLDNSTEREVTNWIKKLQEVQPREVHILTGAGPQTRKVKPVTPTRRKQIAEEAAECLGVTVSIHEEDALLV